MNYYIDGWKKALDFGGRARRSEFWYFWLFSWLASIVLSIVENMAGLVPQGSAVGYLSSLYGLAVIVPMIAVGIRRLHDTGKSGWFILLNLIPCLGTLIMLFFAIQDSQPGPNQYGPNPKGL